MSSVLTHWRHMAYLIPLFWLCACNQVTADKDSCLWELFGATYIPYEVVNNSRQIIYVDDIDGRQSRFCPEESHGSQNHSIPIGGRHYGFLIDPHFKKDLINDRKTSIEPTKLLAFRLSPTTIAYYTGYPLPLISDLGTWLIENQGNLTPSFYMPIPTMSSMDVYGLFYIVGNAGKARLGLLTSNPESFDIYTSLDPLNRPYSDSNFKIIFTVNGPNKSDVVISYQGTPR